MPKLIVTEKGSDKKQVFEFSFENLSIGRSDENNIKLTSTQISRRHANILVAGNNFFLVDLGSGNGTSLNGTQLKANEKNLLKHGDIISIDNYNLNFNQIDEMLASSFNDITDSDILEVKLLKKVLRAIDKESVPSLEVLSGNFIGKKFFIAEDISEATLGREEGCEFQVEEYVISRRHAKILKKEGKIILQDLESKNGTLLNNHPMKGEIELHDGDKITLGTISIVFRNPKEIKVDKIRVRTKPTVESEVVRPSSPDELGATERESQDELGTMEREAVEPEDFPIDDYPTPKPRSELIKLSVFELSMIGLGVVIFIFAIISFISLITK